jgi:D-alanine-D-alanine ligase
MKIIVLAGGLSPERDVSLISGASICKALKERGHKAYLLDVYLGLEYDKDKLDEVFTLSDGGLGMASGIKVTEPDIPAIQALRPDFSETDCYFGPNVLDLCKLADITFMALHGSVGENGKMQSTFDMLGIKYTGPNALGCAVSMDKVFTKYILKMSGIPTPRGTAIKEEERDKNLSDLGMYLPLVVKPADGGSSIGVYICHTEEEYKEAINKSFDKDKSEVLIIEPFIKGWEFASAVLAGKALPLVEILPKDGEFSYENKYQAGGATEICPPTSIDFEKQREIMDSCELAFESLKMDVYSRADYIVDDKDGKIYCFEMNPLPGMTSASLLPKAAAAAGIDFPDLCERIIAESIKVRY